MYKTRLLFIGKENVEREIFWAKNLMEITKNKIIIDIIEGSKRNFLEVQKWDKKKYFSYKYSVVDYMEKRYPKLDKLSEIEILDQLRKYEEQYKINYNYILNTDRTIIKYNKKRIKIILLLMTEFIENILKINKYDKVIGELSNSLDIITYFLCKNKGIKYLSFSHGRINNRISIDFINGDRKYLKDLYNVLKVRNFTEKEKKILNDYLKKVDKKNIIPDYEKQNKKNRIFSLKKEMKAVQKHFKNFILSYQSDKKFSCAQTGGIKIRICDRLNKLYYPLKKIIYKNIWDSIDKNKKEKFLVVPLHYQPEASTLTYAQEYLDQFEHIKKLSQVIPINYFLYVKEHPSMFIKRNIKEYNKIKTLHNVRLISPFEDQLELLKNSKGVITLTNTTGYEAILYKKPVYLFGKVFYQEYDYINKIQNYSELKETIIKNENYIVDEHNYHSFILATLLSLKVGNYNSIVLDPKVSSEENGLNIAKIILEE